MAPEVRVVGGANLIGNYEDQPDFDPNQALQNLAIHDAQQQPDDFSGQSGHSMASSRAARRRNAEAARVMHVEGVAATSERLS